MAETNGFTKMAGKAAHLIAAAGLAAFFLGLFGLGRSLMLTGVALIIVSLATYYVEEIGQRKQG